MLYMPASTLATPIVLQQTQPVIQTTPYYMVQPTTIVPTVPLVNAAFVYPKYSLTTKTDEKEKTELQEGLF